MKIYRLLLFVLLLSACKTTAPIVTPSVQKDSVRVSVVHDSVRVYERDSIFIDRFTRADTIWLTTEKWSIKYRDREVLKHDTIYQVQKETEVVTEKYTPPFYKRCTWGFWILLVLLIGSVVICHFCAKTSLFCGNRYFWE